MNSSEGHNKSNAEIGSIVILTIKLHASSTVGRVYLFLCFTFYLNTISSSLTIIRSKFFFNIYMYIYTAEGKQYTILFFQVKKTTKILFKLYTSSGILRRKKII